MTAAYELPEIAAAAFPHCGYFDIDRYGRSLGRLQACLRSGGDDPVAAGRILHMQQPGLMYWFALTLDDSMIDPGARLLMADGSSATGATAILSAVSERRLGAPQVEFESSETVGDRAVVKGRLRWPEPEKTPTFTFVQQWRRQDDTWRLMEWRVSPS